MMVDDIENTSVDSDWIRFVIGATVVRRRFGDIRAITEKRLGREPGIGFVWGRDDA